MGNASRQPHGGPGTLSWPDGDAAAARGLSRQNCLQNCLQKHSGLWHAFSRRSSATNILSGTTLHAVSDCMACSPIRGNVDSRLHLTARDSKHGQQRARDRDEPGSITQQHASHRELGLKWFRAFGNFWRRGWRMTNGPRMPANHESLRGRPGVPLSVAWVFPGRPGHPSIRIHMSPETQAIPQLPLHCPQHVRDPSMPLTGERSATCPDSVLRQARSVACRVFDFCTRHTMQVHVDLHDDVMFGVCCEMLQCLQNASLLRQ